MYENLVPNHTRAVRGNLFCKGRRRRAGIRQVLIAVPWTSDASIDNLSFSKRPVLVLTDVRYCRDVSVVFEYGDALASARYDARAVLRNVLDGANGDVAVRFRRTRCIFPMLHDSTHHVQYRHERQSHSKNCREERTGLRL